MVMLLQSPLIVVLCCILLFRNDCNCGSMAFVSTTSTTLRPKTTTRIMLHSTSLTAEADKDKLDKYTIKELKQFIIDEKITIPKGMSAKLKRKADIVDFILQQQQQQQQNTDTINKEQPLEETTTDSLQTSPLPRIHNPRRMPPMPSSSSSSSTNTHHHNNNNNDDDDESEEQPNNYSSDNNSVNTATPKDVIIEQILERYPPLRTQMKLSDRLESQNIPYVQARLDGAGENDIRHVHHPIMRSTPTSSDMDVVFVGTASCTPGYTRGVSCTALRLQWRRNPNDTPPTTTTATTTKQQQNNNNASFTNIPGTWLFDVGECSQLQVQKTGSIKPGKISKIFITHAHGDHSFGLPGLLCLMGQDRDRNAPPLEIYGPEGLRMWLRVAIRYSVSRIVPPYRVNEIMDIPMAPEWDQGRWKNGRYFYQLEKEGGKGEPWGRKGLAGEDPGSWISRAPMMNLELNSQFGEVEGGRDIYPVYDHPDCVDGAPIWEVENEGDVMVHAAPMSHGVPCLGYVVKESSKPGRLRNELVEPIAKKNMAALKELGMRHPMKVLALIKALPEGGSYTFPDGTVVHQSDVVEKNRNGRKVVICGDTADCRAIVGLAKDADILIHEATNTYLKGIDHKDTNLDMVTRDAKIHGHSTPFMAGTFARTIGAKRLLLNHFSARYKGDQSAESMSLMMRIERQAMKTSGLSEENVAAAWDFMILPIPQQ